jgi:hypothetical protein
MGERHRLHATATRDHGSARSDHTPVRRGSGSEQGAILPAYGQGSELGSGAQRSPRAFRLRRSPKTVRACFAHGVQPRFARKNEVQRPQKLRGLFRAQASPSQRLARWSTCELGTTRAKRTACEIRHQFGSPPWHSSRGAFLQVATTAPSPTRRSCAVSSSKNVRRRRRAPRRIRATLQRYVVRSPPLSSRTSKRSNN